MLCLLLSVLHRAMLCAVVKSTPHFHHFLSTFFSRNFSKLQFEFLFTNSLFNVIHIAWNASAMGGSHTWKLNHCWFAWSTCEGAGFFAVSKCCSSSSEWKHAVSQWGFNCWNGPAWKTGKESQGHCTICKCNCTNQRWWFQFLQSTCCCFNDVEGATISHVTNILTSSTKKRELAQRGFGKTWFQKLPVMNICNQNCRNFSFLNLRHSWQKQIVRRDPHQKLILQNPLLCSNVSKTDWRQNLTWGCHCHCQAILNYKICGKVSKTPTRIDQQRLNCTPSVPIGQNHSLPVASGKPIQPNGCQRLHIDVSDTTSETWHSPTCDVFPTMPCSACSLGFKDGVHHWMQSHNIVTSQSVCLHPQNPCPWSRQSGSGTLQACKARFCTVLALAGYWRARFKAMHYLIVPGRKQHRYQLTTTKFQEENCTGTS